MGRTLIFILSIIFLNSFCVSQPCLPYGIMFTNQSQIDNFQVLYPNCAQIGGNVIIHGDDITNLDSLFSVTSIDGYLSIGEIWYGNPRLKNLSGLDNLVSVGGDLKIDYNDSLTSLSNLSNLESIDGGLEIVQNNSLKTLCGLGRLQAVFGDLKIILNDSLASFEGLDSISSIMEDVFIEYTSISNMLGLGSLNYIGGNFLISDNNSLTALDGLDNLTSIGGNLSIGYFSGGNPALTSFAGLSNLTSIGGLFEVRFNTSLISFEGLNNLSYIGNGLWIELNNSLEDISSLMSVYTFAGQLGIIYNSSLDNLTGLDNLNANLMTSLAISSNEMLSACNVQSVCEYLLDPNGQILIHDNAIGCNNVEEVQNSCAIGISENNLNTSSLIFPNPVESELFISNRNINDHINVYIYNQLGREVFQTRDINNKIDVSQLPSGLYLIEIVINGKTDRKLFAKQ